MATFDADIVRACALELQERTRIHYFNVLSIYQTARTWTLNGLDPALPLPFDVKVQLDAYKALTLDRLKLEPWASDLQKALVNDTLTYPPPPIGSGVLAFDELSFEHINF
jgi:hypothetical protein